MSKYLGNTAWDVKFSRKYRSGMPNSLGNATRDAKFLGIPNSLGYRVGGCKMSRRDTKFPSEYDSGIPNFRECQIPYDTGQPQTSASAGAQTEETFYQSQKPSLFGFIHGYDSGFLGSTYRTYRFHGYFVVLCLYVGGIHFWSFSSTPHTVRQHGVIYTSTKELPTRRSFPMTVPGVKSRRILRIKRPC